VAETTRLKCPFCNGPIPERLAMYGGPCPHCILEIPGEEAPTDPGLAKRQAAQQAARAEAERAGRTRNVALASLGALLVTGLVVGLALMRDDQGRLHLEFYKVMPVLQKSQPTESAGKADAEAKASAPKPRTAAPAPVEAPAAPAGGLAGRLLAAGGGGGSAASTVTFGNVATSTGAVNTVVPGATGNAAAGFTGGTVSTGTITGGAASTTAAPAVTAAAATATGAQRSPADARAAIAQRYAAYKTQFGVCGDQQLAANPNFEGRWALTFTVQPDGTTSNVSLRGPSNAALVTCVESKVKGWKFTPPGQPLAYSDTVSFTRGY
jgi:hypothetical protein